MIRRTFFVSLMLVLSSSSVALAQSWGTNASEHSSEINRTFTYSCPANGTLGSSVYGTDVYTTDSAVCVAAVHAGVITPRDGGQVTIRILAGEGAYDGSQRNGVSSSAWGSYGSSYAFEGAAAPAGGALIEASWTTTAVDYRGQIGQAVSIHCPGNGSLGGTIYGSLTYTADSSLCVAAVHSGKITATGGGTFTIVMRKGARAYKSTSQNGVTSRSWGSYDSSFEIR